MSEHRIKSLWWEGSNLRVVTDDDRHLTFTDCYPISNSDDLTDNETSGIGEIRLTFFFDLKKQQ
jgi:hypothetical protein